MTIDRDFYKLNIFDVILIIIILLGSTGVILFTKIGLNWQIIKNEEVCIFFDGVLKEKMPLDNNRQVYLLNGKMTIEIKNRQVKVIQSDCIRKICVNSGTIKRAGEIIVCVPNKVLIEIQTGKSSDLDAVVF